MVNSQKYISYAACIHGMIAIPHFSNPDGARHFLARALLPHARIISHPLRDFPFVVFQRT